MCCLPAAKSPLYVDGKGGTLLRTLDGASFFHAVQDFELGKYDFFDKAVRLGREHLPGRVFLQRLDARLVRQKRIVQYVKLVVEHAQRVTLQRDKRPKRRLVYDKKLHN